MQRRSHWKIKYAKAIIMSRVAAIIGHNMLRTTYRVGDCGRCVVDRTSTGRQRTDPRGSTGEGSRPSAAKGDGPRGSRWTNGIICDSSCAGGSLVHNHRSITVDTGGSVVKGRSGDCYVEGV